MSLVNLVAACGIGVEFCAHLLHAFLEEPGGREGRAAAALGAVGAPVLSGITLTKVVGVAVLGCARTAIFRVYFFDMYLALVVVGAAHGLVLLPVLLALWGPPGWDRWDLRPAAALSHAGRDGSSPTSGGDLSSALPSSTLWEGVASPLRAPGQLSPDRRGGA